MAPVIVTLLYFPILLSVTYYFQTTRLFPEPRAFITHSPYRMQQHYVTDDTI